MKAKHKWTDASFDENLKFWHDRLPEGNTCPTSIEEAKKIVVQGTAPQLKITRGIAIRGADPCATAKPF